MTHCSYKFEYRKRRKKIFNTQKEVKNKFVFVVIIVKTNLNKIRLSENKDGQIIKQTMRKVKINSFLTSLSNIRKIPFEGSRIHQVNKLNRSK